MSNKNKLRELLTDILLLEESEFSFEMHRKDINSWDSLAVVAIAVGCHETFGYHFTPDEATSIRSVQDIVDMLEAKGIPFRE